MELKALLEQSRSDNKGVMIYLDGTTIGAIVTGIEGELVMAKSREYGRIVIRLDRINAVAMA